jgi:hypothetical protein
MFPDIKNYLIVFDLPTLVLIIIALVSARNFSRKELAYTREYARYPREPETNIAP